MNEIIEDLLTINSFSRSGKKIKEVKAVVIHWTANPMASAKANRNFFEMRKDGKNGIGSAHYVVGVEGEIIRCIPDYEVAYHCGTDMLDPISNKVYTDLGREKFGKYCLDYKNNSPNNCTIGIELCPVNNEGDFRSETWNSAVELTALLLEQFRLSIEDVITHSDIVGAGFKKCPKLFVDRPEEFIRFKKDVMELLS